MTDSGPDAFQIKHEVAGERATIRVVGELDIATAPALAEALDSALGSDAAIVLLDLDGVTFIDSAGVRVVLRAVAEAEAGGRLRVRRGHGEQVRRLFELVGAIDRLPYE